MEEEIIDIHLEIREAKCEVSHLVISSILISIKRYGIEMKFQRQVSRDQELSPRTVTFKDQNDDGVQLGLSDVSRRMRNFPLKCYSDTHLSFFPTNNNDSH